MITVTRDNVKKLDIFRNFIVDRSLPKHKKETALVGGKRLELSSINGVSGQSASFIANSDNVNSGWIISSGETYGRETMWGFIVSKMKKLFEKRKDHVEKVFKLVLNSKESLAEFSKRLEDYKEMIKDAEKAGQIALKEKLIESMPIKMMENELFISGNTKFISEQNLIKFTKNCEGGLKLDWVKNYIRQIPKYIVEKKIKMDEMCIFDNYVVLHFDPTGAATKMTKEEEIAKAKDPILFGVIQGSNNLYFIGDWKDEICTLTFDDILAKFNKEELSLK